MIRDLIVELKTLDKYEWGHYVFNRDPIHNKVSSQGKKEIIEKANECGYKEAVILKNRYGVKSSREYAEHLGIKISELEDDDSKDYILFARFNSPDKISIYMKNIKKCEELVKNENLNQLLDNVKIEDVLIAHEMFHFIENNDRDIYTRQVKIMLWKLGPIKYHSGLVAPGEIAAMAFARELLQLSYYPNLFDILLLYPHDNMTAKALYDEVMTVRGDDLSV